jgi:hypothetical protein
LFEGDQALKAQRRTITAVQATYELYPGICEPRIRQALNKLGRKLADKDLPIFFPLQRRLPETWSFLAEDNRTRLAELIRQSRDDLAVLILPVGLEIEELEEVCRERINALTSEPLAFLLQETKHSVVAERAVDIYCSSRNWDQANANYRVVEQILAALTKEQLVRILQASSVEGADLNGAHSFTRFVKHVYDHERLPHDEIIAILQNGGMDWLIASLQVKRPEAGEAPF